MADWPGHAIQIQAIKPRSHSANVKVSTLFPKSNSSTFQAFSKGIFKLFQYLIVVMNHIFLYIHMLKMIRLFFTSSKVCFCDCILEKDKKLKEIYHQV